MSERRSTTQPPDFNKSPFLVIWETTRACDLACIHCRASAETEPKPDELSHAEGFELIQQVHDLGAPILVFSGGDPLKRKDLLELVDYAKSFGLRTGTIPAVTPLLTEKTISDLKKAGLDQIAFSLDAACSQEHDRFRQVEGVFVKTLQMIREANHQGLHVQINSLVNVHNQNTLDELIRLVAELDIVFWEVFFLVPVGRGQELPLMSGEKFEQAFEKIYNLSRRVPFLIKITEAPHYRRYYIQRELSKQGIDPSKVSRKEIDMPVALKRTHGPHASIGRAPMAVNAGKGFVFVAHNGEVFPSGFLPVSGGNIRQTQLSDIYRHAELFQQLRNPDLLKGRCGRCEYRDICGGSRSRAYAVSEDYLEEDPSCIYEPCPV